MLHLIWIEDTVRSKLSESDSEACSRDFSLVGPRTMRNYFTRHAAVVSINCCNLFSCEFHMPLLHGIREREWRRDRFRNRDWNKEPSSSRKIVHRLIRAFYFRAVAKGGRSYSPICCCRQVSAPRTRRMWHLLPHEAWRKMIRANSRFHSQTAVGFSRFARRW